MSASKGSPARLGMALLLAGLAAPAVHAKVDCAALGPARQASLLGASLRESPDLGDAEASRIDAQLAWGACRASADAALAPRLAAAPEAALNLYLDARRDLLDGRGEVAERKLRAALAARPEFAPARVLLAQVLLEKEQRVQARAELAQAGGSGGLRAAFTQLRVDALDAPKGDGVGKLNRILRDPAMPPEFREHAQATLLYITALDHGQKEAALREALTFESQTPMYAKRIKLGRFLAEDQGKAQAAREALAPVLAGGAPEAAQQDARVVIAETHLLDAVLVDPTPTERNAAHVAQARAAVRGDLLPVAKRIRQYHNLTQLRPFVAGVSDPDARDAAGQSALCRAARAMDAAAVQAALDAGAAVDGECAGATALAYVVRAGEGDFARRRAVLEVLLAGGADPDPKLYPGASWSARGFCADNSPGCRRELLPLLDAAAARRAPAPAPTP